MSFSVSIYNEDFPVVILKDESQKTEAVIYSFGALLNSFKINGRQNIIDGFESCNDAKTNIKSGFKSCKLSPFVCRIKNSEYSFQQKQYKTGKAFINKEALHGLLFDVMFTIAESHANNEAAFVILEYNYSKKDEGFPFKYSCTITYKLEKNNNLSVSTTVTNRSDNGMPLCDGWHPYFKFDQPINDLYLKINANKILAFDDKLLPTGKMLPFNNFQTLEKLNETFYDNCFLLKDTQVPVCIIEDRKNNLRLNILPSEAYPYLQIFTPAHRNSIAIENLSSAPDAFNNKMGLIILKPEETKVFTTFFQAAYLK